MDTMQWTTYTVCLNQLKIHEGLLCEIVRHQPTTRMKKQKTTSTVPCQQYSITFQIMMSPGWWPTSMQELGRRRVMGRYLIQHRHQRLRGKWRHIVIGGTLFAHKDLSSIRWEHYKPDRPHHEQQQIKAISIGLQAVRHAHIGSGHNLVIAKIGLKLRRAGIRTNKSKWFDVKLEDPELFYIMLRNR